MKSSVVEVGPRHLVRNSLTLKTPFNLPCPGPNVVANRLIPDTRFRLTTDKNTPDTDSYYECKNLPTHFHFSFYYKTLNVLTCFRFKVISVYSKEPRVGVCEHY